MKTQLRRYSLIVALTLTLSVVVPFFAQAQIDTPNEEDAALVQEISSADAADDAALEKIKTNNLTQPTGSSIHINTKSLFSQGGYTVDSGVATLPARVGRVINIIFALSGTIFLAMVIYAGIRWMTASGDSDQVKTSQKRITRASIGLLIMLSSWILTNFILRGLFLGPSAPPSALKPGGTSNFLDGRIRIDNANR